MSSSDRLVSPAGCRANLPVASDTDTHKAMHPGWGAGTRDNIQMLFIELHAALAKEPRRFLPEGARAMVLHLPVDGMQHVLSQRRIHSEGPGRRRVFDMHGSLAG